ncbi:DUF1893 domain-containing protein [Chloroflexota bacterium]
MYEHLFNEFLNSSDTLQVYQDGHLVFSSQKDRLVPLLEYINRFVPHRQAEVVFDKIMGNAAALLAIKAGCREVYSPLGSQIAVKTLDKYGVKYQLTEIIPFIQRLDLEAMCPMEELSLDKEPEVFYEVMMNMVEKTPIERHGEK